MNDQVEMRINKVFDIASGDTVKNELNQEVGSSNIATRVVPDGKKATIVITIEYMESDA